MKLENGFVKITGATDLEDSSMAVGMCALFDCLPAVDIFNYFNRDSFDMLGTYRRCLNSKYLFSRDQTICFVVALLKANMTDLVSLDRVDGKDIFSPSVRGHINRCMGLNAYFYQDWWLWLDVWFHATCASRSEPNQLLCMMMIADPKYLKWWVENNHDWEFSITDYWCGWRNEPELAEMMIAKIKERISV